MNVLLLGFSSIAQRRVIPALAAIDQVRSVDIASIGKAPSSVLPKLRTCYRDYAEAISGSDADTIYISLPNSMHVEWITKGLAAGKHIIVDKPATLTLDSARTLVAEAERRDLLLAEAIVFDYHPQFDAMRTFVQEHGALTHIHAEFIIPPMPTANFRNFRALGGGCLLDMGPYAAAIARRFGSTASSLAAFAAPASDRLDVDVGFSIAVRFANGVRYTGHFSFESEYQNRLTLVANRGSLIVERIFSPPADLEPVWQVRESNQTKERHTPAADVFRSFLEAAFEAIQSSGERGRFLSNLMADAIFRADIERQLHSNAS